MFLDTFLNTVPNILCVVGQVFKQFGWEIVRQATSLNFTEELANIHTVCFLKQVTIKNDMYGKRNLNRNIVNDIWFTVCWSS